MPIPALGKVLPFPRVWVSTDVSYRGKQLRFIDAHLESLRPSVEIAQGLELLAIAASTSLPVIVAADINADASNPSDPTYQTYFNFLNAGFTDAWTAANPFDPGFTKPLPLRNKRGDLVLVRGRFRVLAAALFGEEVGDMTPTGLWPSDHCGVVARLQLPKEE